MKDIGVLEGSQIYFFTSSEFAKQALYYFVHVGDFYTNTDYCIKRNYLDNYLLMFIEEGEMYVEFDNVKHIAKKNTVVILNCFNPHIYFSKKKCHFKWFHFSGNSSNYYYYHFYKKNGCIFKDVRYSSIPWLINEILDICKFEKTDEEFMSLRISEVLYELNNLYLDKAIGNNTYADITKKSIQFIKANYRRNISLEEIASIVNVSPYYFTRIFKEYMKEPPISYLNRYRLNEAKKLLHNSDLNIKEIAFKCGFNSESYFTTFFKRNNNMLTPGQFRQIEF